MSTNEYETNEHGIITSPGKFEGEFAFVPHLWDIALDGADATTYDGPGECEVSWLIITDLDRTTFPILANIYGLSMWESESGFVFCDTYPTKAEYDARYQADMAPEHMDPNKANPNV